MYKLLQIPDLSLQGVPKNVRLQEGNSAYKRTFFCYKSTKSMTMNNVTSKNIIPNQHPQNLTAAVISIAATTFVLQSFVGSVLCFSVSSTYFDLELDKISYWFCSLYKRIDRYMMEWKANIALGESGICSILHSDFVHLCAPGDQSRYGKCLSWSLDIYLSFNIFDDYNSS